MRFVTFVVKRNHKGEERHEDATKPWQTSLCAFAPLGESGDLRLQAIACNQLHHGFDSVHRNVGIGIIEFEHQVIEELLVLQQLLHRYIVEAPVWRKIRGLDMTFVCSSLEKRLDKILLAKLISHDLLIDMQIFYNLGFAYAG